MAQERIDRPAADQSSSSRGGSPDDLLAALQALRRNALPQRLFRKFWHHTEGWPLIRRLLKHTPVSARPAIAGAEVYGRIDTSFQHGLTLVSHELSASGAPKLIVEIARVAVDEGVQPVVISPTSGPFLDTLVNLGAIVVIDPTVTDYFCASSLVLNASKSILVNTAACFRTISRLDHPQRVIWYFHETELIDLLLANARDFAIALGRVGSVWAVGSPTRARLDGVRPDILLVPPGIQPLVGVSRDVSTLDNGILRLALIGGIEPRKGHDIVSDAISSLPRDIAKKISIRAIGAINSPPFAESWLSQIAGLESITYEGPVAPDRVSAILDDVHGVIIPSRDEPFSLVALEALSCGRLVVCSRRCGISAYLTDSLDAYIADQADGPSFSDLLRRVLADSSRWDDVAQAGKRTFFAHFTSAMFAQRIRNAIVLGRGS